MRRSPGITLVELMVSLVIVGMLVTASLAVIGSLSRRAPVEQRRQEEASLAAPIQRLLKADLLQALQYRRTAAGFSIKTFNSLDQASLECRHLKVTVEYQVRQIGAQSWLVRLQQPEAGGTVQLDLVCSDVQAVSIQAREAPPSSTGVVSEWQTMPPSATVLVEFQQPEREAVVCVAWRE